MKQKDKKKKRNPFRHLHFGAMLPTVFTVATGVMLLALTENNAFATVAGVLFAVAGVLLVGVAFLDGKAGLLQILFGALFIGSSVWLFADRESGLFMLYYVFAGILLLRGLFGMWGSLAAQCTVGNWWKIQLFGALFIAVFAIILLFNPFDSVKIGSIFIGVFMLLDAVLEFCSGIRKRFAKSKEEAPQQELKEERKEREKQERAQQKEYEKQERAQRKEREKQERAQQKEYEK